MCFDGGISVAAAATIASVVVAGIGTTLSYQAAQNQAEMQSRQMEISNAVAQQQYERTIEYQQKMANATAQRTQSQMELSMQNMKAQAEYANLANARQMEMYEHNAAAAEAALLDDFTALDIRMMEEENATVADLYRLKRQKDEAVGQALNSSEGAGNTLALLNNAYLRDEALYKQAHKENLAMTNRQIQRTKNEARATMAERVFNYQVNPMAPPADTRPTYSPYVPAPVQRPVPGIGPQGPNPFAYGLNWMGKSLNSAMTYYNSRQQRPRPRK